MSKEWKTIENPESGREYLISRVCEELNEAFTGKHTSQYVWNWLDTMHDKTLLKVLSKERRETYEDYLSKL